MPTASEVTMAWSPGRNGVDGGEWKGTGVVHIIWMRAGGGGGVGRYFESDNIHDTISKHGLLMV